MNVVIHVVVYKVLILSCQVGIEKNIYHEHKHMKRDRYVISINIQSDDVVPSTGNLTYS